MMGGVAVLVSSLLLLLWFLDNPYHGGVGSLKPVAMERTLDLLREEANVVGGVEPRATRRAPEGRRPAGEGSADAVAILGDSCSRPGCNSCSRNARLRRGERPG